MPDKDHPIWPIIRWIVIAGTLFLFLKYNYLNGFTDKDIYTMLGVMSTLTGFDLSKKLLTTSKQDA